MMPDEARSVHRLPLNSTTARVSGKQIGGVLDGVSVRWRVLQLFNFRVVLMWPSRYLPDKEPRP
jgi:hypothetical protein